MVLKRIFDIAFSIFGLLFLGIFIFFCWIICTIDTRSNGLFVQERIGQFGKLFKIYKLKSINDNSKNISKFGIFIRKYKIDELPQLLNILKGNMSFVGPRPDIAGYYDKLDGDNRKILNLKPGLTSTAAIKYANEDEILQNQKDAQQYNDLIIFPDKVKMNLEYYYNQSFLLDLQIIIKTFTK